MTNRKTDKWKAFFREKKTFSCVYSYGNKVDSFVQPYEF